MSNWMQAYEDEIADLLRTHEQDVREQVAQAIEAHAEQVGVADPAPQQDDYYAACHDAARIARGEGAE